MELNSYAGQSFTAQTFIFSERSFNDILVMFPKHMMQEFIVCFEYQYIIVI